MPYVIYFYLCQKPAEDYTYSLKVKSGYIEHLRQLQLISDHFLPEVFSILGLYEGAAKAFKLDIWSIEEFYLDCMYSLHQVIQL